MNIYMMGNKVSFQIQNEKNIREIIDSISEIIASYGYSIVELKVDGKIFYPENPELEKIDIDSVSNLEVETLSFFEISSALVLSLESYARKFYNYINSDKLDFGIFDEAKSWIINVLSSATDMIFVYSKNSDLRQERDKLLKFFSDLSFDSLGMLKEEVKQKLEDLIIFVRKMSDIVGMINSNVEIFFDSSVDNDISDILRLLDEVPTKIQTGEINKALSDIKELSEAMVRVINFINMAIDRSYKYPFLRDVIDESSINQVKSIREVLDDIIVSLRNNDYVMASDLIAYELSYRVKNYLEFVYKIRDAIFKVISVN